MKRFFALVALVLGLASCQTEPEGLDVQMGGAVDATITVNIPETETRAGGANSAGSAFHNGIIDDADYTVRYILQVFNEDGSASKDMMYKYSDDDTVAFDVRLVPGRNYRFVVWADIVNAAGVQDGVKCDDLHYVIGQTLQNITLAVPVDGNDKWAAMDETRDAYTGIYDSVEFSATENITLTLKRPFAKLRVITTDMNELFGGVSPHNAEVKYTTPHYNAFNAFSGEASGERTSETHTYVIADYADQTGANKVLFTDYFFANESGVVKFTMDVKEANEQSIKYNTFNTDIAVKRNYLTTISGNILTDGNKVNVTVEDTFGENNNQHIDYKTISSDKEFLDAVNGDGGKYIVISDLTIADAGTTVNNGQAGLLSTRAGNGTTINLNGYTITLKTNITIAEGKTLTITDINENGETGAIINAGGKIVNNGTLNIEGGSFGENTIENNETEGGKVNITGGTFKSDPSEFVDADYNVVVNNGVYSLELKDVIAKIGDVEYRTLQKAFDAVDNGTIQLVDNVTLVETATLAEGKTATLDLNGKTLAHTDEANKYALSNLGTLTITGNGTVNSRGIYNGYGNGGEKVATAKLTIENGTFNAKGENGGAAVFNYGTANINGGSFTSIGGYSLNNQAGSVMTIAEGVTANNGVYTSDANLTINGGEISGNRSGCHVIYCWNANITINGGTFYNNNSGNSTVMAAGTTTITYNGGTYGIKDGRVPGNGNTWTSCLLDSQNSAEVVVNDGTYNGGFRVQTGTSMTINGGSFNDCYGSAYNISGTVTVKGGTYTDATAIAFAKKYVAEGYEAIEDNGVWTVHFVPATRIGETEYATLQEAFNVGGEITLLRNITVSEAATLAADKTAVLDLNGFTIYGAEESSVKHIYAIKNYGSMTIKDTKGNGSIDSRGIYNYGTMTLNSGKISAIDGNGGYAVNNQSGSTFVMNGGWIAADYEDGDAPTSGNYDATALNIPSNATATLNGGKITNAGNFTFAVASAGTLNIPAESTLTVDGRHGTFSINGGETTINAGTYSIPTNTENTDNVVYVYSSGKLVINGGTFIADNDTANGGCCVYDTNGGVTINGGVFGNSSGGDVWGTTGTTIKGGKFENLIETSHIAEGYEMNANGEVVAK